MSFRPYLMFGGDCRAAMTRYQEIFGGDLQVMSFADSPPEARPQGLPAGGADLVMHAALITPESMLMASDDPTPDYDGRRGVMISHTAPDEPAARRVFDALAEGGTVIMPLGETFWAPVFGMCIDRFGTSWMVDAAPAQ